MLGLGRGKGEPKAPKVKKERQPRDPITKEKIVQGLMAFVRNALLVASVAGILVLSALVYMLFQRVGGASADPVTKNLALAATALTAGGCSLTLWLGRMWGFIPF